MKIKRFEDLECWKEARKLVNLVYKLVKKNKFYKDDRLRDQTIGAGISIMNNIAEGFDSQSNIEFIRFLRYSRRSCSELLNCFYIAMDQEYITEQEFNEIMNQTEKTRKCIDGLLKYLRKNLTD